MITLPTEIHEVRAEEVAIREDNLVIALVDGRTISVPLAWYPRLWYGTEEERSHFEIIGDGAYIHWPDLDEDLSLAGILAGRRSGENPACLKKWLAARSIAGFDNLPARTRATVRHHESADFMRVVASAQKELGRVSSRLAYKLYDGSASWLGATDEGRDWLGHSQDLTIWKVCYYGEANHRERYVFGVRLLYARHFHILEQLALWDRRFKVPPHHGEDQWFVGFAIESPESAAGQIATVVNTILTNESG